MQAPSVISGTAGRIRNYRSGLRGAGAIRAASTAFFAAALLWLAVGLAQWPVGVPPPGWPAMGWLLGASALFGAAVGVFRHFSLSDAAREADRRDPSARDRHVTALALAREEGTFPRLALREIERHFSAAPALTPPRPRWIPCAALCASGILCLCALAGVAQFRHARALAWRAETAAAEDWLLRAAAEARARLEEETAAELERAAEGVAGRAGEGAVERARRALTAAADNLRRSSERSARASSAARFALALGRLSNDAVREALSRGDADGALRALSELEKRRALEMLAEAFAAAETARGTPERGAEGESVMEQAAALLREAGGEEREREKKEALALALGRMEEALARFHEQAGAGQPGLEDAKTASVGLDPSARVLSERSDPFSADSKRAPEPADPAQGPELSVRPVPGQGDSVSFPALSAGDRSRAWRELRPEIPRAASGALSGMEFEDIPPRARGAVRAYFESIRRFGP